MRAGLLRCIGSWNAESWNQLTSFHLASTEPVEVHFGSHFDFLLLVLVQFSPHYGVGHGLLLSCRVRDYGLSLQRNLAERLKRTQEVWTLPWVSNLLSDDNRQTEGFFSAVFFYKYEYKYKLWQRKGSNTIIFCFSWSHTLSLYHPLNKEYFMNFYHSRKHRLNSRLAK